MEKSFAFNSIDGDRMYKAEDFTAYFASFIGNGIFPNPATNLQVIDNNDMTITIKSGKAWINGYFYINTEDFILKLSLADGVLNRIDRVVLRLDFNKRSINLYVKKGEFASSAIPKQLERNSDIFELGIADISIKAGSISITQNNITDLRLNKEYCGIVHGVVEQVDTTSIFNQFQSWYSNKQNEFDKDIDTWTKQKKKGFETWLTQNTQNFLDKLNNFYDTNNKDFEKWFNALKEKLKGDVATNLLNEVSATKEEVKDNKKEIDNLKVSIENTDKKIDKIELTAAKVTIKDADNLFSSNNVEGALKEVYKYETNNKYDIDISKNLQIFRKNKDDQNIFTLIEYKNKLTGKLYKSSELSNKIDKHYTIKTVKYFDKSEQLISSEIFNIKYDSNGLFIGVE